MGKESHCKSRCTDQKEKTERKGRDEMGTEEDQGEKKEKVKGWRLRRVGGKINMVFNNI